MKIHQLAFLFLCAVLVNASALQSTPDTPAKASEPKASQKSPKAAPFPEGKSNREPESKDKNKDKDSREKAGGDKAAEPEKSADPMSSAAFMGMKLRNVGPALVSGRVVAIAVNPKNKSQYFVGVASGGVWRTDNDGTTYQPVFDHEGSYSIGAITIDPKQPRTVWVGTGEANAQRSVSWGDGVYRSDDSGRTWKNMGLKKSEHIGKILIDPRDSGTIYVAAQGPLWGPGGDRGLYKSTDGGRTWNASLTISENTGVTDVVMDPSNPDTLFAAAYQRRRHVFTIINGGPEAAIYKSIDAGKTWNKLTGGGLPDTEMGRIGLAISPVNPGIVYAIIEAVEDKGGIYRSADSGANWEKRNVYNFGPMYYSVLVPDPKREDRLYISGFIFQVSDDGGRTIHPLQPGYVHVDNHIIWIDPDDLNHMMIGNDGGLYTTRDGGATFRWASNLPTIQFYDVAVDNSKPFYYIYGGTQDNHSLGGPSRTRTANGITSEDWFITAQGDGFRSQVDPEEPNTVYAESQEGGLIRFNRRNGELVAIRPRPEKGEMPQRWDWDSPIIVSPHSHTRLYFAGHQVFRSDDRGDSWKSISPDLTRQIDRDTLPVMGKVWGPDSVNKGVSTSFYGNIVALAESPVKEGLLVVGTDDGLIQITEDGGAHWRKIENIPGVPERTYVSRVAASRFDEKVIYAAFEGHKDSDFRPYVLRSADLGHTWTSIAANLPENGPVLAFVEDTVNRDLLFAGTEYGLWFTVDGGKKWIQLKGGLPTIAVRDAVIQARESDLVIATFGRGFYVLDNIAPLRSVGAKALEQEATLFPVRDTMLYIEAEPFGGHKKAHLGDAFYLADNPPYGAVFTYMLKEKFKTLKEKRRDAEKEIAKKKGSAYPALPYPNHEQLTQEAEEVPPAVFLTVRDSEGNVVRQIQGSNERGINRTAWDLRYPPAVIARPLDREAVFDWDQPPSGPLVMPGDYTVQLSAKVRGEWRDLAGPQKVHVYTEAETGMKPEALAARHKFQRMTARLERAVTGTVSFGESMKVQLEALRRAIALTDTDTRALMRETETLELDLDHLMIALRGDPVLRAHNQPAPVSITERAGQVTNNGRFAIEPPTGTDRSQYAICAEEFADALAKMKSLQGRFDALEKKAEGAGAPWTPGRLPEWKAE